MFNGIKTQYDCIPKCKGNIMPRDDLSSLISSLLVCFLVLFGTTSLVSSQLIDNKLFTNGRYGMVYDALDTISEDDVPSIVAIGSSQMYKGFNGSCMADLSENSDAKFYNLALPASRSYTDMLMIPRILQSDIDIVMIEVGVNLLFEMKPTNGNDGYVEMRLMIDTMLQNDRDLGKWQEIILSFHNNSVNSNEIERIQSRQDYSVDGTELILSEFLGFEEYEQLYYRGTPEVGTDEWIEYLQEPVWTRSYLESLDNEERTEYSVTQMKKSLSYRPLDAGTANHAALHYEVSSLSDAGIKVILVGLPHHPEVMSILPDGQWDGYNKTVQTLVNEYDIDNVSFTFSNGWEDHHFSDRNHLDADGRKEFCERMTPLLNSLLES
jgi:hypothetical protein